MDEQNQVVDDRYLNELKHELGHKVVEWVERKFNILPLPVLEEYTHHNLIKHIVMPNRVDSILEWVFDMGFETIEREWVGNQDGWVYIENIDIDDESFDINSFDVLEYFKSKYGESMFDSFIRFIESNYNYQIEDYIDEQTVNEYPLHGFVFEVREDWMNDDALIDTYKSIGFGVLKNVDYLETMLFLKSSGVSFLSHYWIPLYLALYDDEESKYSGVDYSGL